jgi:hypothetical protein
MVTACLVTRGDQPEMIRRICASLIFDRVLLWDNSVTPDWKTAGRYMAAAMADTELVYFQDDDVIVPRETQQELLRRAESIPVGVDVVATWAHGDTPDGYADVALVGAGAIASRTAAWEAIARYGAQFPIDSEFMYEADFAVGVLYPRAKQIRLPFEINYDVAQHETRLCNQPWQKALKYKITNRARRVRDAHS